MVLEKESARQQILKLVEKYKRLLESDQLKDYNETRTRREFIEQLFGFLGWDMFNAENENEVISEESIENGRPDLTFKLNGRTVMILEAKAFKADLDDLKWAEQAVSYAWNQGVSWAILTDFEAVKIFYAEISPKDIAKNPPIEISYQNYVKDFDFLYGLLSKESVQKGSLDQWAGKVGKAFKRKPVGDKLFEDLTYWRSLLTKAILKNNNVAQEDVDNGVQKILDRLIFIRTAEDRKLENTNPLRGLLNSYESGDGGGLYVNLIKLFKDFDAGYDSTLFVDDYSEKWKIDDKILLEVLNGLCQTKDGYRYDFAAISVDVLGSIYQHYLGYVQQKSKKGVEIAESKKRKTQGIFYTPRYIADFIVKETLGELLKKTKPKDISKIKVLDPACGSGSFLTAAYEEFLRYYEKHQKQPDLLSKLDILKKNLYGVDLDGKAVEIAQLNLLLKVLFQRGKLPNLQHNIRSGNSLVSGNEETLKPYFGERWQEQKPFNWEEEFKEVFNKEGFNAVIGNPPYGAELSENEQDFLKKTYEIGSTDTAILFIKRAFNLLSDGGKLGLIVPKALCFASNYRKIREFIWNYLEQIVDAGKAWKEVKLEQVVFILKKGQKSASYLSSRFKNSHLEILGKINKKDAKDFGFFLNGISPMELAIAKKIKNGSKMLNEISTNQRGAPLQKMISDEGELEVIGGAQVQRFGVVGIKGRFKSSQKLSDNAFIKNNSVLVQRIVAHIANPIDHIQITAAVPEKTGSAIVDTINQIVLEKKYSQYVIWCLLNSKLISWYAYRFIFGKAIRTMQFDNPTTSRIPISNNLLMGQERLLEIAKEILALGKQLRAITPDTLGWQNLNNKIGALDRKIDQEIYKLYGLTGEEIKVIELA